MADEIVSYIPPEEVEKTAKKELHEAFRGNTFELKERVFKSDRTFDLLDDFGNFLMRAKKESFRLTRRFHLYGDKKENKELLSFRTRGSMPETYDVTDPTGEAEEQVGIIRHNIKGSLFRTNWEILSPDGEEVLGGIKHVKPFVYEITTPDGEGVATMTRKTNLMAVKFTMNIHGENPPIDRRLLLAANIIMAERSSERKMVNPIMIPT